MMTCWYMSPLMALAKIIPVLNVRLTLLLCIWRIRVNISGEGYDNVGKWYKSLIIPDYFTICITFFHFILFFEKTFWRMVNTVRIMKRLKGNVRYRWMFYLQSLTGPYSQEMNISMRYTDISVVSLSNGQEFRILNENIVKPIINNYYIYIMRIGTV